MTPTLSALAISVLATLAERPMHPYETYQLLLERREDWLVKVRPGSLYHTVERLADLGLLEVTGTDREGRRPERTTYSMTAKGRRVLKQRIGEIVSTPVYEYPVFPVALSELHEIPIDEALEHLQQRAGHLDERLADLDRVLDDVRAEGLNEAYWFSADFLRAQLVSERDWIRRLIDRMKNGELQWPTDRL